jgi:hypothetical protein
MRSAAIKQRPSHACPTFCSILLTNEGGTRSASDRFLHKFLHSSAQPAGSFCFPVCY